MESEYLLKRRNIMLGITSKPEKETPKPIAKKSDKRKGEEKEYKKIVKEMIAESDKCEMHTPDCTKKAQGLHHQKKRAGNYLNKKYLIRSCNACNLWAELNPLAAIEMGISISKFNKN